jgi:hypothetical protein
MSTFDGLSDVCGLTFTGLADFEIPFDTRVILRLVYLIGTLDMYALAGGVRNTSVVEWNYRESLCCERLTRDLVAVLYY